MKLRIRRRVHARAGALRRGDRFHIGGRLIQVFSVSRPRHTGQPVAYDEPRVFEITNMDGEVRHVSVPVPIYDEMTDHEYVEIVDDITADTLTLPPHFMLPDVRRPLKSK